MISIFCTDQFFILAVRKKKKQQKTTFPTQLMISIFCIFHTFRSKSKIYKKKEYRKKRTLILIRRQITISLFCIYCISLLAVPNPKEKKQRE